MDEQPNAGGVVIAHSRSLVSYGLHVGGEEVPSAAGATTLSVEPATGDPWAELAEAGGADVDRAVTIAREAFEDPSWRGLSPTRRGRLMMRLADRIAERAEAIATVESRDNGRLLAEVVGQVKVAPEWLYYYGGLADKVEGRVIPLDRETLLNYTLREPLGVVGVITPWNSPIMLTMAAAAPALAAGNTLVIKPSEFASAGVLEIARLVEDAGFPPGVVNVVTGGTAVGEALVDHPGVAKISFTGGTEAGRAIASKAGGRLIRSTLELGGKSPNVVFADADPEAAEAGVIAGIFGASGQTCIAGSRALVQREIFDDFVDRLVARAEAIRLGDPSDPDVQMGPLATEPQLEKVERHVEDARAEGATVRCGGRRATIDGREAGFFYEPTIVVDAGPSSGVAQTEIFGPVLTAMPFDDEDDAIRLANDTPFGLAAGVWTLNVKRAHRVARRLEAGTVWVNRYRGLAFSSPFGGYKASGIGRTGGIAGIEEYLQTKSVWCELSDEIQDPFVVKF